MNVISNYIILHFYFKNMDKIIQDDSIIKSFTYNACHKKFIILFLNILKKYNLPLLLPNKNKLHILKNEISFFITWHVNHFYMRELFIPHYYKDVFNKFLKNNNQRFIAFPIILYNPTSIINPEYTTHALHNFSHLILLVYDKKYKYFERFDSANNLYEYDSHILDTNIVNTFKNTFNIQIEGINTPWMICRSGGIQMYQEREIYNSTLIPQLGINIGFCSIYTLWYLEQRLIHQNQKPCDIIFNFYNILYKNIKTKFPITNMIINYTKQLLSTYNPNTHFINSLSLFY